MSEGWRQDGSGVSGAPGELSRGEREEEEKLEGGGGGNAKCLPASDVTRRSESLVG